MNRGDGLAIALLLTLAGTLLVFRQQLAEWACRQQGAGLKRALGVERDRTKDKERPLDLLTELGRVCASALMPTSVADYRKRINLVICLIVFFVFLVMLF